MYSTSINPLTPIITSVYVTALPELFPRIARDSVAILFLPVKSRVNAVTKKRIEVQVDEGVLFTLLMRLGKANNGAM